MELSLFTQTNIRRLSIGYFAVFFTMGVARSFLGPSLLEFSDNTDVQLGKISILFVLLGMGNLCGNWISGRLFDRLPGNLVLVAALVSNSLLLVITPLIIQFHILAAAVLMLGIGYGTVETGGNSLMMWLHGKLAGPYLSGLYVFIGLGSFATPALIGISIEQTHNLRFAFLLFALFALPAIILLLSMPSPRPGKEQDNRNNMGFDFPLVVFICLLFFLSVGSQASFSGWLYTYAVELDLTSDLTAAFLTSIYWVAQTTGLILSIPILVYLRPKNVLIGNLSGGLISLIILLIWKSPIGLWVGTIGLGLSMASLFPASFTYVGERMSITGKLNGWFLSAASLGAMMIPWIVGQVFSRVGPHQAMQTITAALGLGFVLLLVFLGKRRRCEQTS